MAGLIRRGLARGGRGGGHRRVRRGRALDGGLDDYDALVLDVMLPGSTAFETCERLRASSVWTPVLPAHRARRRGGSESVASTGARTTT